jgi:hypothetical protein
MVMCIWRGPSGSIVFYGCVRWGQTQRTLSFPYVRAQVAGWPGIEMGASVCVYIGTRLSPPYYSGGGVLVGVVDWCG